MCLKDLKNFIPHEKAWINLRIPQQIDFTLQ